MKKFYEAPVAEEIRFATEDILDGSDIGATDQGGFGPGGEDKGIGGTIPLW